MLKLLCALGLHMWEADDAWGSRCCKFCQQVMLRLYSKERGAYWERKE